MAESGVNLTGNFMDTSPSSGPYNGDLKTWIKPHDENAGDTHFYYLE